MPVYSAKIVFTGSFPALDAVYPDQAGVRVMLDQARLAVGVSHTQAISSASALTVGDEQAQFRSGTEQAWIGSGVHALIGDLNGTESMPFAFELQLKGTRVSTAPIYPNVMKFEMMVFRPSGWCMSGHATCRAVGGSI